MSKADIDYFNDGVACHQANDIQGAFDNFTKAIEIDPNKPEYRINRAKVALQLLRPSEALREIAFFDASHIARIHPNVADFWSILGETALNCYKFSEAISAYDYAVHLNPDNANAWCMLGFVYGKTMQAAKSLDCYRKAIAIDPELGTAHFLICCSLIDEFYDPETQAFHAERAMYCKKPTLLAIDACWNAAHAHLALGDYKKGWEYFESRLVPNQTNRGYTLASARFKKPQWNSEKNVRVLIHAEMGFGDVFMMARFLPIIVKLAGIDIQVEIRDELRELMEYNYPDVKFVQYGIQHDENTFDFHLPMMSLPYVCGITSEAIPWDGPYLRSDAKFDPRRPLTGGVCWAGGARAYESRNSEVDKKRSLKFDQVKPLLEIPGIEWVSLMPESNDLPHPEMKTFMDTARIIEQLNFVLTVDTAVANLAGAMGKKVLLMNRYDTCYRWSDKLKSKWYPTVIDFRQTKHGDWHSVLEKIKLELETMVGTLAA